MDDQTLQICQKMFNHACSFSDCAEVCEHDMKNVKLRTPSHAIAGIVNSAFSCEVFLKMLLVYCGVPVNNLKSWKHGLLKLWKEYEKKDADGANRIRGRMDSWFRGLKQSRFDELMKESSDAFYYWRYIYENGGKEININFLKGFRLIVRDECCIRLFNCNWGEYLVLRLEDE